MKNPNTWREFTLQTLVRQGGGKTDVRGKGQWREDLGHKVVQFAQSDYHECELFLVEWGSWDKYVCHHCEEVITRPVDATNEAKRSWHCDMCEDGSMVCMVCIPVLLRTELVELKRQTGDGT